MSQLTNDEELPYRYRSIFLHFPEYIAEEAGDARANYRYRFKDSEGKIYRLANCIIPGTAKGREMVDKLLRDAVTKDHSERMNRLQSGEMIASTGDWCSSANSEGFYCPYFACWADENQQHCVDPDGGAWSPEIDVIDEPCDDECGGGGFPDWPGDDEGPEDPDDPWDPNP
ncbi:MAG: hypothetical protein LAT80_02625, partial [Balneolaceae bacterium]|nr:hypothetical protein [Balneolaceae bacterium]